MRTSSWAPERHEDGSLLEGLLEGDFRAGWQGTCWICFNQLVDWVGTTHLGVVKLTSKVLQEQRYET